MTGNKFCDAIREQRCDINVELPRNIFGSRWNITEGRIVLVQKLVIKPLPHNPARALLDFADVNQHSGSRIDGAGENEIGDVIATASVARFRFGTKDGQIFVVAPFGNMQATGSRKFESLADGQKHSVIPPPQIATRPARYQPKN